MSKALVIKIAQITGTEGSWPDNITACAVPILEDPFSGRGVAPKVGRMVPHLQARLPRKLQEGELLSP